MFNSKAYQFSDLLLKGVNADFDRWTINFYCTFQKHNYPELPGWRVTLLIPNCHYDLKYAFSSLITSPGVSLSAGAEHGEAGDERWV